MWGELGCRAKYMKPEVCYRIAAFWSDRDTRDITGGRNIAEFMEWAEEQDNEEITVEKFQLAAGHRLSEEQIAFVNAAIWGFLSGVLSGSAETLFKRAEVLNGLDAWRRMVRHIDHGRHIRLEALRREVRTLHLKPIKDLDHVDEGAADFKSAMLEVRRDRGD